MLKGASSRLTIFTVSDIRFPAQHLSSSSALKISTPSQMRQAASHGLLLESIIWEQPNDMTKRCLLGIFLRSSISIPSYSLPLSHAVATYISYNIFSLQNSLFPVYRLSSCTSTPGAIDDLVDPDAPPSPTLSVSADDFAFLRDLSAGAPSPPSTSDSERGKFSEDAFTIARAINSRQNYVLSDEAKSFLRKFRGKLNESLVVQVLRLVKDPHSGVQFFIWAGGQIGYRHSPPVYDALLDVMGFGANDRVPDRFLREIGEDDREVLGRLLNVLIQKCCRTGMWNVALEDLGKLKDFGYKPSGSTYNALVHVFLKAGRLDTADLIQREMSVSGFRLHSSALGSFVFSLCKAGRLREAYELMEREEFTPDTILYTSMISGLCEASLFEEAMGMLNIMRCSSCMPNVVTFRVLLCGCLNKRQLGRCKKILCMMTAEGCYPSRQIFHSLVHAYCKSGDFSYAQKLLKKMEACGCGPDYVVYNILIGAICGREELPSSALLEMAEEAYSSMLDAGLLLNKINISNFSRCLCGAGKFDKAYNVIREMMSKGFVPDASTYTKVIEFLCNSTRIEKAFLLFEEMKRSGIVPDVYTYSILIDGFCKAGLIVQAHKWFDEMLKEGCTPNVVTYTSLIHAYLKVRKMHSADELFERMLSDGIVPNVVTYTALIDGHCKAGCIEKACQIYARMKGHLTPADIDKYFSLNTASEPNIYTYGALVDGLCKAHKVGEAHDLLDAMFTNACEPNHIIYDALIDGLCKLGRLDAAQEVFAKMSERGYIPNEYTYGSLIDKMFKDKRLDLALKVLSKMLESSVAPNVVIYTEMVDGLCKVGKTDEAYKLLLLMGEKGCTPNVITYTAIIDGFGKAGKVEKCLQLFKDMGEKGCAPNYVTYGILIKHCCSAGFLDDAYQLLEEMKQTYWPVHLSSYQKVIEGFSRDFLVNVGVLDAFSHYDSVPVIPVYKILIDSFFKAGRLETALALYREVISFSWPSSVTSIDFSLMTSLCLASKVDEALELFSEMTKRSGIVEVRLLLQIIMALIRLNRWEEAFQLSYDTCLMVPNSPHPVEPLLFPYCICRLVKARSSRSIHKQRGWSDGLKALLNF